MKETEQMAFFEPLLDFLHSLPNELLYLALGVSAFVENVFPPIPADTITAFGAFLVGTKRLHFFGVLVSTTLGSLVGFMTLFWFGCFLDRRFFIEKDYWFFKAQDIIRAEDWFRKYGYFLILLNRFFPGIRSALSIAGGISNLKAYKVAVFALISSSAWNLIWMSLGYALGHNWTTVRDKMGHMITRYNLIVLSLFAVVILFLIIKTMIRKRR